MQENVSGLIEHIVVDGASEDSTLEIVKRYTTVRWISESDDGIADAFNKGLHLAKDSYILFLNADDYLYDPNVLSDVCNFINNCQDPGWIVGDVVESKNDKLTPPQRRYPPSCWSLMLRNRIGHQSVFLNDKLC